MYKFNDTERASLTEFRAITKDEQGHELLVGLTLKETSIYMMLAHKTISGVLDDEESKIYLELHERHEKARLEIIGAEAYVQAKNPLHH